MSSIVLDIAQYHFVGARLRLMLSGVVSREPLVRMRSSMPSASFTFDPATVLVKKLFSADVAVGLEGRLVNQFLRQRCGQAGCSPSAKNCWVSAL